LISAFAIVVSAISFDFEEAAPSFATFVCAGFEFQN